MAFRVKKCFHAVGNGTLFSGQIQNIQNSEVFNWLYDCGCTSPKIIQNAITNLPAWFHSHNTIDMLVISHFDDDHVNGLEILLKTFNVKRLVLPFTEWSQSIREISILGKKGTTPSIALFQLNPVKWLKLNGFENRINEIILVEGGENPDSDILQSNINLVDRPDLPIEDPTSVFFEFDTPVQYSNIKLSKMNHFQSFQDSSKSFEFMFYNAEKSFSELGLIYEVGGKRFAKKSGQEISSVKADIEKTIISLGLDQHINNLQKDWRKKLKNCYEKHFGKTGKAKNNISLCMYSAPAEINSSPYRTRFATLLTGDINLSPKVIDDMELHFGKNRWQSIGVVQVPHHGSKYSWTVGNTAKLMPAIFVHCANPTIKHPHPDVKADLQNSTAIVFEANRKLSVDYNFRY
ncbi:hypothetical protein KTI56_05515 [Acinetobacter pittii]|uniref:hypothetical protein n=1 Tax=Acinetobacter pittii TaxID=48296 RepID=UPI000838599E|nr:hypothetical protein [Acinetobacter pittii]MCK0913119.1 hypothetical protein [Acinetobacter pittii]MCU4431301.1 hypothetical protein [Acinetobacter pittii]MCU4533066.1 hypothetical protein [Acinetobacter pittii]OCY31846.1 hypothetical protein BFR75_08710 [Acinetobacter pittii]ODI94190.1 hypothetical protein BFR91_10190 [Acinetobacter pittii]